MAELVAHLERTGYVERVSDPTDGRAQLVTTRARGLAVFAVVREFVAELDARLDEELGAGRVAELRVLLQQLQRAVEDAGA